MLHQFCRLDCQRHRKILEIMKLLPIAIVRELLNTILQVLKLSVSVVHRKFWGDVL